MDVGLHWTGSWPEELEPLLEALEGLEETADAPDGDVVLCPDASLIEPPSAGTALVACVPRPETLFQGETREARAATVGRWAARGALLLTPTATTAELLRVMLAVPAERVRAMALPLPQARRDAIAAPAGEGTDVVAVPPIGHDALLQAVLLLRHAGLEPRLVLADPDDAALVRPGGRGTAHGMLSGHEIVAAPDWRAAARSAAALVLADSPEGPGWSLREALATGRPVVVPSTAVIRDHLAAAGAHAYMYHGPRDLMTLMHALAGALRRTRGPELERNAREAVLAESWPASARVLYGALHDALVAAAPAPAADAAGPRVEVAGERLRVSVLNPHVSGGGGERFMRQLVEAMARHRSAPEIRLIAAVDPGAAFDTGVTGLGEAGVDVRLVPVTEYARVAPQEVAGTDVVYCSWPHMTEPPVTSAPLVCTFHDLNWKHFDVMGPNEKALLDRQAPQWVERSSAIVHSSNFIREEMRRFYATPDRQSHVIPLTAESRADPTTAAERDRARRRFALPERFLVSPAGRHLHKNYPVLDAALRVLRRDGRPISVVASGLATDVHHHGPDLIGLGYISARELQALYELSDGMVQTSLYEAGSFPMWEAMAAGKPVAISRIPPVLEQVERLGAVVELFDPLDPEDVAAALWRLWKGSPATAPETLAGNAAATAARTWDDVASEYLEVFANVCRDQGAQAS